MQITKEDLKLIPAFKNINNDTKDFILKKGSKQFLNKNSTLFIEQDNVTNVYVVICGKVSMYRFTEEGHRKIFYILDGGSFLNEPILDGLNVSVSCEAFEDSIIFSIERKDLLKIMETDFHLTKALINSMSKKIRRLYRQLRNSTALKIDKRVAAKLWKMASDHGIQVENRTLIDLNITITYLSDMMGNSRESISRAMKLLASKGLITYSNKKLLVDKAGLLKYYRAL